MSREEARLAHPWRRLPLLAQLGISMALLVVASLVVFSGVIISVYREDVVTTLSENALTNLQNANRSLNEQLGQIESRTTALLTNRELFEVFAEPLPREISQFKSLSEKVIQPILQQNFSQPILFDYFLYTDAYVISPTSQSFLPHNTFPETRLYREAMEHTGRLVWVPTFRFAEEMRQPRMMEVQLPYDYLVAAVRRLNLINLSKYQSNNSRFSSLPDEDSAPILLLYILESDIRALYESLFTYSEANYWIVAPDGTVVSTNDRALLGQGALPEALRSIPLSAGGIERLTIAGTDAVVCYDPLPVPGWQTFLVIPHHPILGDANQKILGPTLRALGVILLLVLSLCLLISFQFTHPIANLKQAMGRIGEGEFDTQIPLPQGREMRELTQGVNDMSRRLAVTVHENYEIRLREKETQLMALNLQINPHFLYNALNTINYMAIGAHQEDISEMLVSLSSMLHYAVHHGQDRVPLSMEMHWLRSYTTIMTTRYAGQIEFLCEIGDELLSCVVPKLFLQPIIENAYLHGCAQKGHGMIELYARREGAQIVFTVRDDGVGMPQSQIDAVLARTESTGIGLTNVIVRLRHLYEENFHIRIEALEGEGTTVVIAFPWQER